jgi:two-component system response regulator
VRFKSIPVVMLTTSDPDKDVVEAYAEHVNCNITKPLSYASFKEVIRKIEDFWIHTVRLPE